MSQAYPMAEPASQPAYPGGGQQAYNAQSYNANAGRFDIESGNGGMGAGAYTEESGVAAAEAMLRQGFIRKVLGIVAVQLIVTFGITLGLVFGTDLLTFAAQNIGLYYAAFAVYFGTVIAMACCGFGRKHPQGYIALTLVTLSMSYLMAVLCSTVDQDTVLLALGGTAAIVFCLGLFAFQTKYDFTGAGPYLFVALIALLIGGIFWSLFGARTETSRLVYAVLAIILFGFFLVYDLQLIIGGKHKKYQFEVDEYAFAALNIYLDIVIIFQYLLIALDN